MLRQPRNWFIGIICVLMIFLASCEKTDFVVNSYRTIMSAGLLYDTAMKAVADLDKQGKLPADKKEEIKKVGLQFYNGYILAAVALKQYDKVKDDTSLEAVTKTISELLLNAKDFRDLAQGTLGDTIKLPEVK